jgi:predicted aldo/keto reductase-like oxidoreductase
MEKIRLGKTNMMVSRIGFGGIPIQNLPEEEAIKAVKSCVDQGITFLDSSRVYTTSEERIGKAIAGLREDLILATKSVSRTADAVAADLEASLQNLRTDYIDLYQFHNVSTFEILKTVLDPEGPMTVVREAKEAGKIKHIGVTSHALEVAKEAIKSNCFETIMVALNFVNTEVVDELLPLAQKHDVGIIAMKPLAGGMLDKATLAFKYLLQFPDIVPLVGIAKGSEMKEIIQVVEAGGSITEPERLEMERIKAGLGTGFCRMCNYCQPCPQEIQISAVMYARIAATRFDPERVFKGLFNGFMEKVADCSDCGECETRCPYGLPIREKIVKEAEYYFTEKKKYMEEHPE